MTVHLHSAGANCYLLNSLLLCTENICSPLTLPCLWVLWIVLLSADGNLLLLLLLFEKALSQQLGIFFYQKLISSIAITHWNKRAE